MSTEPRQDPRSRNLVLAVAALLALALVGAWIAMRGASPDPAPESSRAAVTSLQPARTFDPGRARELRKAFQQGGAKRLALPVRLPGEPAAGLSSRSYDAYLIETLGRSSGKLGDREDALGPKSPRVDVKQEGGVFKTAEVDLDRDGKWDERWEMSDGRLLRRISPEDDGRFTKELAFVAGVWTLPAAGAKNAP